MKGGGAAWPWFRLPRQDGVGVTVAGRAALIEDLQARLAGDAGFAIATLNLDHVVKLRWDAAFRVAYLAQTHVVADGNPIVWLCRLSGRRVELVPGADLVAPLVGLASGCGVGVALVGSTEASLAAAGARLERMQPAVRIVTRIAPPMGFDPTGREADALLDAVAASGARLVLLALGAPKQEMLAARGLARHPTLGFVSIGAGIDFLAGTQRRAPSWMRGMALEWLWRMVGNPRRFALRYASCAAVLPRLALRALGERFQGDGVEISDPSEKRTRSTEKSR